jgi:hypothetical protein
MYRKPDRGVATKLALRAGLALLALTAVAAAQPAKSEMEHLVPPQGGAVDVPVHAGAVCILPFPEQVARKAITSSPDQFEINRGHRARRRDGSLRQRRAELPARARAGHAGRQGRDPRGPRHRPAVRHGA